MKNLLLFATGGAVGYVLGAKAGRERYDQLMALAGQAPSRMPGSVADLADQAHGLTETARERAHDVLGRADDVAHDKLDEAMNAADARVDAVADRTLDVTDQAAEKAEQAADKATEKVADKVPRKRTGTTS